MPHASDDSKLMSHLHPNTDLEREERFWDQVGSQWLTTWDDRSLIVEDPRTFLTGSSVAFDDLLRRLGDIRGMNVLDYGCGSGWLATYLAKRGAFVEGFDISSKLVELGMKRASVNGVADAVRLRRMIAEELQFPDNSFDRVVGISILHHVDLHKAALELARVMKPGALALFIEPLGESKLLDFLRNYVCRIHHGQIRDVDAEHPLTYADIRAFGEKFRGCEFREFQLTEMIARLTGDRLTRVLGLRALDELLLRTFPALKRFCRLVVIQYSK